MTKLSRMAVVAALAAFASTAAAQEGGWDTKYGMLFDLQNVFQNGSAAAYGSYGGNDGVGIGAQMNLAPTTALRLYVNLARASDPGYDLTLNGVTYKVMPVDAAGDPLYTSEYNVKLGAQYMLRMSTAAISPYFGVGASIRFDQGRIDGDEGLAPNLTNYDVTDRTWGVGLDGTLGLEWRVHKSIALFAEYVLDVTAVSSRTLDATVTTTTAGVVTVNKAKFTQTRYLNFDTGVGQAGQVGVIAFF